MRRRIYDVFVKPESGESSMRMFVTLAILAIAFVGGVSVFSDKLTIPADERCISCD
jgi:hypothetical protein